MIKNLKNQIMMMTKNNWKKSRKRRLRKVQPFDPIVKSKTCDIVVIS